MFFFQAEDGIRDLVRSRGLGDVYKRQLQELAVGVDHGHLAVARFDDYEVALGQLAPLLHDCLLYTSDAADERSSVDLGGRRIIKKKNRYTVREIYDYVRRRQ
mgnify:CR=1 FL=1